MAAPQYTMAKMQKRTGSFGVCAGNNIYPANAGACEYRHDRNVYPCVHCEVEINPRNDPLILHRKSEPTGDVDERDVTEEGLLAALEAENEEQDL